MNKKIINNAMSAYFWLWALLLLPSKKENINDPFVKSHSKTALFIHVLMLLNYLIFITYSFLGSIVFYGFWLNHIFASILFLALFWWLLYGISKANRGENFSIFDMATMSKSEKIIELKNSNLNEQWILTIILSLIPFLWFVIKWKFKNYKSPILESNLKLNLIVSIIISLFFIAWNGNLWLLLILLYTIFTVFYSILVITKQSLITLKLEKIKTMEEIYIYIRSLFKYLTNYFKWKSFSGIQEWIETEKNIITEENKTDKEYLLTLKDNRLPKYIAYIPYLNIIWFIDINTKNKFHIINGIIITLISSIIFVLWYHNYQILILFLMFFWFWYTKIIEYKFPFLFDMYKWFVFVFWKVFRIWKNVREKQIEIQEVTFTSTNL